MRGIILIRRALAFSVVALLHVHCKHEAAVETSGVEKITATLAVDSSMTLYKKSEPSCNGITEILKNRKRKSENDSTIFNL